MDIKTAELVSDRIAQLTIDPITYLKHTLSVSVSIGISLFPEDGVTEDELMHHADSKMYINKRA